MTSLPRYGVLLTPKYSKKKSLTQKLRFVLYTRGAMILGPRSASPLGSAASLAIISFFEPCFFFTIDLYLAWIILDRYFDSLFNFFNKEV